MEFNLTKIPARSTKMYASNTNRPKASSHIFAESAWWPSLERYIDGETSDQRSMQDQEMIAIVCKALQDRDEVKVVCVSMLIAMEFEFLSIADQRCFVVDHDNVSTHSCGDWQGIQSTNKRSSRSIPQQIP
jgi:hypothetical protein